jgi:hypothetical protein
MPFEHEKVRETSLSNYAYIHIVLLLGPVMRNKTITLCLNSFEIAQKMPNFSEWVRSKLLDEANIEEKPIETYLMKCPMGHQMVKKNKHAPLCPQCQFRMTYVPSVQLTLGGLHDEL